MESERVSLTQAAKEIGCHTEYLRIQMRNGNFDIGKVIKPSKGHKQYMYLVFRPKLDRFLGKIQDE